MVERSSGSPLGAGPSSIANFASGALRVNLRQGGAVAENQARRIRITIGGISCPASVASVEFMARTRSICERRGYRNVGTPRGR